MIRVVGGIFIMLNVIAMPFCKAQKVHVRIDSIEISQSLLKKQEFKSAVKTPLFLIAGGLISYADSDIIGREEIAEQRNESIPNFRTHADDYLQYGPIALVYGLNALGIEAKHGFKHRTALLMKSELLMMAAVLPLKKLTRQLRPDGSNYSSFPSGHTAQAFVAATFMHKEYGHLSPWYSIGAYSIASSVGILRILNNRHFSSDVLVGAGLGILATNIVYLTDSRKTNKKNGLVVSPTYNNKNIGLAVVMRLN